MGGSFIWIVLAIVAINIVGGLLQQAAKKKEAERKLEEARRAAQRGRPTTPPAGQPVARQTPTVETGPQAAMTGVPRPADHRADVWEGRAAGDRSQRQRDVVADARLATEPSPTPGQLELERRRQVQLEELRRRRAQSTTPRPATIPTGAPPPPPPRDTRGGRAAPATVRTRQAQEVAPARTDPSSRAAQPGMRQAPVVQPRKERDLGTIVPLDEFGRAAARTKKTSARVGLPNFRGPSGLARLREAVILREIIDRPLALREPEGG